MATRTYIVSVILSIGILMIYSMSTVNTRIVTVSRPSLITFERLHNANLAKLQCPCSQLAISYRSMLDITLPRYHQVRNRADPKIHRWFQKTNEKSSCA